MRKYFVLPLLVAVVMALAAFVAACGGKSDGGSSPVATPSVPPEQLIQESLQQLEKVKSSSFALDGSFKIDGDPAKMTDPSQAALVKNPTTFKLTGKGAEQPKAVADLTLTASAAGKPYEFQLRVIDNKSWVRYKEQWYVAADDSTGIKAPSPSPSQDAARMLKGLGVTKANTGTTYSLVGVETIDGVATYHVQMNVDTKKAIPALISALNSPKGKALAADADVSSQMKSLSSKRAEINKQAQNFDNTVIDLWIGSDDKLLRKITMKGGVDLTKSQNAVDIKRADLNMTMQMSDFNKPVEVTAPTGAKPSSQLMPALMNSGGTSKP